MHRVMPGGLVVDGQNAGPAARQCQDRLHVRHVATRHRDTVDRPHGAAAHHSSHRAAHHSHAAAHSHPTHHSAGQRYFVVVRVSDIRFRRRVGRELGRRSKGLGSERGLIGVGEFDELVRQSLVKGIHHRCRTAGPARHVEDQIGSHRGPEDHSSAIRRVGLDRLPVERDDERLVPGEFEAEDPRRRGIDQAKPDALAAAYGKPIGHAAIDRDGIPDPSRHAHFHRAVEAAGNRGVLFETPVPQDPDDVAVDSQRLRLFDDEGAYQAAPDLFGAVGVRVIPIGARIGDGEFVGEALLGLDRRLGHVGRAVHRVRDAHAVPMDRGVLGKLVLYNSPYTAPLRQPDFGPRGLPVVGPYRCLGIRRSCQRGLSRSRYEMLL